MNSSFFYFNPAFKVRKSVGIKASENAEKDISGSSRPWQPFVQGTEWLCFMFGLSENWMETKIIEAQRSVKWSHKTWLSLICNCSKCIFMLMLVDFIFTKDRKEKINKFGDPHLIIKDKSWSFTVKRPSMFISLSLWM